jgi:DNA-binding response OmpR family regulator
MRLLLVEDNLSLADGLREALMREGFAVNHVATASSALAALHSDPPDLLVLDLGLPDRDGLQILKSLRNDGIRLPVLLLTARDTIEDKVNGLDSGADDYLAKPFEMAELLARLRVLERRLGIHAQATLSRGDLLLSTRSHDVSIAGIPVELSRREYMLLKSLMENAGRVQTRDSLESSLYSWGEEVASNALEVHIHNLRKKLGSEWIRTVRGVGYMMPAQP